MTISKFAAQLRAQPAAREMRAKDVDADARRLQDLGRRALRAIKRGRSSEPAVRAAAELGERYGFTVVDFGGFNGLALGVRLQWPPDGSRRPTIILG